VAKALLGELLVSSKVITREQLDETLAATRPAGKKIGHALLERGWITEGQLTQCLSLQLGIPWVSLTHIDFSRALLDRVPRELAERLCLVPIFVRNVKSQGDTLYVATDDPKNEAALAEVSRAARLPVRPMIASTSDIRSAIRVYYADDSGHDSQPAGPPPPADAQMPPVPRRGMRSEPAPPPPAPPAPVTPAAPPTPRSPSVPPPAEVPISAQPVSAEPISAEPVSVEPISEPDTDRLAPSTPPEPVRFAETIKPANIIPPPEPARPVEPLKAAEPPRPEPATPRPPSRPDSVRPMDAPKTPRTAPSGPRVPGTTPAGGVPAKRPRMLALTLLDGTQLSLPARGRKQKDTAPPTGGGHADGLTTRDLVSALRAMSHGADASEILGETAQWEAIMAALLSILLRKGIIADWEFIDEYKKI
jgi:type IV pilus assembly protein PilB